MSSIEQEKLDELLRQHLDGEKSAFPEGARDTILRDLKPVRRMPGPAVFAASFLLIAAAIATASVFIIPSYGWNLLMPLARTSVFLTLAASAALLAFSLSLQMAPGSRMLWTPGLLVTGISVLTLVVLAAFFQVRAEPQFLKSGLICARAGTPFAVPAAVLFAVVLRRGAVLSPKRAGMISGMLAGMVSMAVLEIHCPNFDLLHIVLWHFGIPLGGALAGYLLGLVAERISKSHGMLR